MTKPLNEEEAMPIEEFSVSIGQGGHHVDIEKYLPLADSFLSLVLSASNVADLSFTRGVVHTKANTSQYPNKKIKHETSQTLISRPAARSTSSLTPVSSRTAPSLLCAISSTAPSLPQPCRMRALAAPN